MSNERNARLIELLADVATVGLSDAEQNELASFERNNQLRIESELFELSAAAADLACFEPNEELPDSIRDRLLVAGGEALSQHPKKKITDPADSASGTVEPAILERRTVLSPPSWRESLAYLAAAACLVLVVSNFGNIRFYQYFNNHRFSFFIARISFMTIYLSYF